MRYALIDNSTLTGIQRLLGEIPVKNKFIVDNDIIAFENYIQAILFYDEIICIDDYKSQYRENRKQYFPKIRFISKDLFDYESFVETANKVTENINLEIKGGRITDRDFKDYLDRLHMTFQFTWDMSSSQFFLTQKMWQQNPKDRAQIDEIKQQIISILTPAAPIRDHTETPILAIPTGHSGAALSL